MNHLKIAPFGSWKSIITSDFVVKETVGLSEIRLDQGYIYWIEMRPEESGRNVLVKYNSEGLNLDITPSEYSVRSRVHEYGGGAVCITNGVTYFVNNKNQLIYRQFGKNDPELISKMQKMRYADLVFDKHRNNIVSVRESHNNGKNEPLNESPAAVLSFALIIGTFILPINP